MAARQAVPATQAASRASGANSAFNDKVSAYMTVYSDLLTRQ